MIRTLIYARSYDFFKRGVIILLEHNILFNGDCREALDLLPDECIHLVITSPPYYNARPEYSTYNTYDEYLQFLEECFKKIYRVVKEGRYIAVNTSPVIEQRENRNYMNKRFPIPFDLHQIIRDIGFEFTEDIMWFKPIGSAENYMRNLSFRKMRIPLTYYPNLVTEYIMIYKKYTDKRTSYYLDEYRNNKYVMDNSVIDDPYEKTNVWSISPASNSKHPAVFPDKLVSNLVRYYSFIEDFVLDPFAGSGTVGKVCNVLNRHYVLMEQKEEYFNYMKNRLSQNTLFIDSSYEAINVSPREFK